MQYRPEIDGLRAVALVPVVLFHAGLGPFGGGYVGVDVFFVISGYLITVIILADRAQGRFSVTDFYRRRVRRIVPALFAMVACCIPPAVAWMMPDPLAEFGTNLLATSVFASNLLLWQKADYFAPASELNPLLHIWSLALEGQFYLLFPALFLIRSNRLRIMTIAVLALLSLVANQVTLGVSPEANFFLLPTRAWELLLGALCAALPLERVRSSRLPLPALGLAMIVFAVFYFDADTPWPSLFTLLPVIGTCLIVMAANAKQGVGRLLASAPLVGIGLISYSTYLWHQPLFAFARIRSLLEPPETLMVGLAMLSFGLGYLSWRYVEMPFRRAVPATARPRRTGFAIGCWAALVSSGIGLWLTTGLPARLSAEARAFDKQRYDVSPYRNTCQLKLEKFSGGEAQLPLMDCVFGPGSTPSVAFLGDSHAGAMAATFAEALVPLGVTSTAVIVPGCVPFVGYRRTSKDCDAYNRRIFDYVLGSSIDTVVLIGRYSSVTHHGRFDNGEGGIEPRDTLYDTKTFTFTLPPDATQEDYAGEMFRRGITRLLNAGLKVILVYPVPEAGWNVPDLLTKRAMFTGALGELSTRFSAYTQRQEKTIAQFEGINDPRLAKLRPAFRCHQQQSPVEAVRQGPLHPVVAAHQDRHQLQQLVRRRGLYRLR